MKKFNITKMLYGCPVVTKYGLKFILEKICRNGECFVIKGSIIGQSIQYRTFDLKGRIICQNSIDDNDSLNLMMEY